MLGKAPEQQATQIAQQALANATRDWVDDLLRGQKAASLPSFVIPFGVSDDVFAQMIANALEDILAEEFGKLPVDVKITRQESTDAGPYIGVLKGGFEATWRIGPRSLMV